MISKETLIDDLVNEIPESVSYLRDKGIKCLACGDPIWGTLEEAAKKKGFTGEEIEQVVYEINKLK
jgi:methionine synthase II (cobalamin-independent)